MVLKVRYLLLPFLFLALVLSSCFKSNERLLFRMTAKYDSTVTTGNVVTVSLQKTKGDDDMINLTVEGLPDYINADFGQPIGELPAVVSADFHFNNPLAESNLSLWKYYTVIIKGTTRAGTVRKASVTFFCYPQNAAPAFDGRMFYGSESCSVSGTTTRIVTVTGSGNTLRLTAFFQTLTETFDAIATVNARTRTITIPPFTQGYYTFSGSGTFNATAADSLYFNMNFSRKRIGLFDSCSTTFTVLH